jgi:hypothetical protein
MNRPAEAAKFLERALATNPPDAAVKTQLLEAIQAAHRAHKSAA